MTQPIRVGVVGLGFMGATHIRAFHDAQGAGFPCRVAAVADRDRTNLTGHLVSKGNLGRTGEGRLFDPTSVRTYEDPARLARDPDLDLISICTHTDSHVEIALEALARGKHVLVEKPVSLHSPEVDRLAQAARASGRVCMPAMCMRFWPAWTWLKQHVESGVLGTCRSATFHRLGSRPDWSPEFYRDATRSGGALTDLHIHDVDFIHWCFGPVTQVRATGSVDHLTTTFKAERGPAHLVAEAGWDHAKGWPFRMRFVAIFDKATAEFDIARPHQLMVYRDGGAEHVPLEGLTGYDHEVRHALAVIGAGKTQTIATMDEALQVSLLLDAARLSLERGRAVSLP
ncbi:MAG: Gfo/Idh/MocA family oxidoreductase [Phycisphaerales bacterium]|nr:Gfo/Idh/MocA family oxidoreductase [Phycisphaerales bacterium]